MTSSSDNETPMNAEKADAFAKEAYELIYNTPREVVQEMDERLRELRRPDNWRLSLQAQYLLHKRCGE